MSANIQKILILAAIPHKLRLDQEIREIEDAIRRASRRDLFDIRTRIAVRTQDMRHAIAEEKPQIVHFCGHGLEDGSLLIEDEGGYNKPVTPQGLAILFKQHADYVNCVLFNSCHSVKTAISISEHINYVIGMNREIGDRAAIVFSQGFYDGLGYEKSDNQDVFKKAFQEGLTAIALEDLSQVSTPVLKQINLNKNPFIDSNKNILNIYIERPPIEEKCLKAILQPGALIRIKAPQKMGKTLLLEKLLDYSREQGYQIVKLDFKLADQSTLTDLKTFLKWLCSYVSDTLEKSSNLDEYWQDSLGLNTNCTRYFQRYLLANIDTPLVLAIDNFERLFQCENIFSDFCLMLRSWYDTAKQGDRMGRMWQKLRLVVVNSTEVYPTLDTNRSPFNVGLAIDLPEFNQNQVKEMVRKYQLDSQLGEQGIIKLMTLVGGHPFLLQLAISSLKNHEISLESLLNLASTEQGIFSSHLREQLASLQMNSQLKEAYKQVAKENQPVQFNPEITFKLHSLGLVKILRNDCIPSCGLYRQYFSVFLN
ncbi:MAG: AAA-like domain-containing protein [Cyanobacteria bacterium J06635_10]